MIEILWRKSLPTSVLQMAEIKFDSYQSWQLLHDTISEANGTQGRDLQSLCIWQSHFPEYNNHLRIRSWTKLEIKTPRPGNHLIAIQAFLDVLGDPHREEISLMYKMRELLLTEGGRETIFKDKKCLEILELKHSTC